MHSSTEWSTTTTSTILDSSTTDKFSINTILQFTLLYLLEVKKKHSHVKFYRVVIFQFSKRREGSDNKTNGCHALMSIAHTQ